MLSLIVGLVVCAIDMLNGTPTVEAVDYAVDFTWWFGLVTSILALLVCVCITIFGVASDVKEMVVAGILGTIFGGISNVFWLFSVYLVSRGISPTEVTSPGLVLIGVVGVFIAMGMGKIFGTAISESAKD